MQQRTAIARALANDPKILLLDEPFGALDNQTRALMQEMLLGIWEREQKTVLFVTHDIEEAIFVGSRVVVMSARPGRIKADIAVDLPHPRPYTIKTSPDIRGAQGAARRGDQGRGRAGRRGALMRQPHVFLRRLNRRLTKHCPNGEVMKFAALAAPAARGSIGGVV